MLLFTLMTDTKKNCRAGANANKLPNRRDSTRLICKNLQRLKSWQETTSTNTTLVQKWTLKNSIRLTSKRCMNTTGKKCYSRKNWKERQMLYRSPHRLTRTQKELLSRVVYQLVWTVRKRWVALIVLFLITRQQSGIRDQEMLNLSMEFVQLKIKGSLRLSEAEILAPAKMQTLQQQVA